MCAGVYSCFEKGCLKGIVGGFEFTVLQRNLKELAQKAMKMCLRRKGKQQK